MRSTVSAMNGCQCRIPTYTGHAGPSASWSARAWASVRSRMGERPPMRAYRSVISATSSGAVARPPRTSRRYGSTSSRLPGPPYAISSTATRSAAMHPLHDRLQRLHRRLGEDAVSQVEDVPGASAGAGEHVPHLPLELRPRRQERYRIEVALNGTRGRGPDPLPRNVERDAPVDADHIAARPREIHEQGG